MTRQLFDVLDLDDGQGARQLPGVVVGIVTNNQDPDGMGRIKVKFPWLNDEDESYWTRVCTLMAGKDRGVYFLPEVGDEVLVAFEHGDRRFPYVLGSLWNGQDTPPTTNNNGKNDLRLITSRSGHVIRLNDEDGKETVEIIDKNNNSLLFDSSNNTIKITAQQDLTLSASQGTITLDARTIEIKSSTQTTLQAGSTMDVKANATMSVKGATVNIN
ncbi:MAG: phage baseplate assembly protein V [Nitrospira sp.]